MTGLIKISGCDNPNRRVDVIFVHGLGGHPQKTWHPQEKLDNKSWLFWLGEDLKDVGVWSFGYEAEFSNWKGKAMPRFDQARNFAQWLEIKQMGKQRPLFFITHSLGGLLVKEVLRNAETYSRQAFINQVKGIVFLATPHNGSHLANTVGILNKVLRITVSVEELEVNNPWLRDLDVWYRQKVGQNEGQFRIITQVYYETRSTSGCMVVEEGSADPKILDVMPIALPADHMTIAKPQSREDLVYESVRNFIQEHLRPLPQLSPANPVPPQTFVTRNPIRHIEENKDPQ
ncbi:hypothetical protein HW132_24890 [Brasilonema sp. CT11]|nr:hypothetical protein [Brasilonema sp. CT11]